MRVIGTAGHVDHGKSTLVRALTGIDPDRLLEEKARQMTIDLGFAWFKLADGELVGVVDVPGHRDFIENMLAGIGGIDAVLLIVAADEGVMPQTREHLAILDLLGIERGLIVLTKVDAAPDQDWLELVEQDVQLLVQPTSLAGAPVIRVSARTGTGLDELKQAVQVLLSDSPARADVRQPRLPVDRVFSMSGFGTVVTGTLAGGRLQVGDEVEFQPGQVRARIRGLQSYSQSVDLALPGSRVAVNLSGVEREVFTRGQVLAFPGQILPSVLVDVRFRHLADAQRPLQHNDRVKVFVGAAQTMGRVRLIADEEMLPGQEGWLQLELSEPLALAQGDRLILRRPSPSETIGGGLVVNPNPDKRWKRFREDVVQALETRLHGSPVDQLVQAAGVEPVKRHDLLKRLAWREDDIDLTIQEAVEKGALIALQDGTWLAARAFYPLSDALIAEVSAFHRTQPLRLGMPREELRTRLGLRAGFFNALLGLQDQVEAAQEMVWLKGHEITFTPMQAKRVADFRQRLAETPYTPPSTTEASEMLGNDVLYALIDLAELIQVQPEVILTTSVYHEMVAAALEIIDVQGSVAVNQLRDRFNTTRKYAIGLLEHLDSIGVTRREGDARVRGPRAR